ncbi:MAG TPA: NAD kinase [Bacteroidia bacterium]|jgi:NAD+ kinase|nr:NAD kinase [Bacteroidia bacterium]
MKIAIYGRTTEKPLPLVLQGLFDKLEENSTEILISAVYFEYLKKQFTFGKRVKVLEDFNAIRGQADFLMSLGGDGTILETIAYVRNSGIPILGINTGRLGFLAGLTVEEALDHAVERLKAKQFMIDKRSLLKLEGSMFGDVPYALNEFTVQRKDTSAMMTIHASVNGEFLNSYWADGLIIATPTGSTAYSLSCGGPLVVPDAKNFIITPLSPHNLNVRPLIVSEESVIKLKVEGRSPEYLATLDARSHAFPVESELTISKGDFKVSLIRFNEQHFFHTIREKLIWGHDARN